ncbi:baseplate wedge subunit [Bacillus phage Shbh1]|uniref:Baseplate J family-like protein n=1 Tax=Bacillus phage Shbh1 TaxID=1796992 RepID=A0A142F1F6_9CAUD|nr:baseplate wedge subunit [Bacillus phage Shbh1]AMQ66613.1 baseplate J family-like protein [Bacillus phage Shbh1]
MRFKRMVEIYSRMVDHTITTTNEINDFTVGSAMRSLYESVAIELEQFYVLTRENMREAIERGVYESFGFTRKPAIRAYGVVQVVFHNPIQNEIIIPRGSTFMSRFPEYDRTYETLIDYIVPAGSIITEVEVYCTAPGESGNVPVDVINVMRSPIGNVKEVRNPQAIQTGQNEEPLEELRARFHSYIETLSRATLPAIEYGTREVPEVAGVYVDEQTGLITVYAHDRNGNLPDHLRERIIENLYYYRPAGIKLDVKPVTRHAIDITVEITITRKSAISDSFRNRISATIIRYLNNMQTANNLILSDLSRVIMNIDRNLIYDVKFIDPTGNINVKGSEILRAGIIDVKLK